MPVSNSWGAALLLVASVACRTAAPDPGVARRSYGAYGTEVVEVVAIATAPATDGSDARLQLVVEPPAPLELGSLVTAHPDAPAGLAARYAQALADLLASRGYHARAQQADGEVAQLLTDARARGADAVLLCRFVPVTRVGTGLMYERKHRVTGNRQLGSAARVVVVENYLPQERRGLLLLSTVQLLDTRTGALLYRGPALAAARGEVPAPTSGLLEWGSTQQIEAPPPEVAPPIPAEVGQAPRRASQRALAGLPRAVTGGRRVDDDVARRVAATEEEEARRTWSVGVISGVGLARFPISLDLGPATVELDADAPRRFTLQPERLFEQGSYGAGLEVTYRQQRMFLSSHVSYRHLPGHAGLTYVRTDPDIARAFPLELGPAHELGLDLFAGYQRLLWPSFGLRAMGGPAMRFHYVDGQVPRGTQLDQLGFALGAGVGLEPFARFGPAELGLRLRAGFGYSVTGGPYGAGDLGLRAAIRF